MTYKPWFQKIARYAVCISYRIVFRVKITGRENIPQGGCMSCANHPSLNDPPFVLVALGVKHEVSGVGKKELFENKFLNCLFLALGGFPVDRDKNDLKAIKQCLNDIKAGKKLILFPEGTRTRFSNKEAKSGLGLIAVKAQCPIIPIYLDNIPKPFGKINIIIGEPILPPKREDKVSHEEFSQSILDHIFTLGEKNES